MSRCSSLVFKRAVAPEICDYGLTNLEGCNSEVSKNKHKSEGDERELANSLANY